MGELLSLLKDYNFAEVIIILVLTFVAIEWVYGKVKKVMEYSKSKRKGYHEEESAKEKKEKSINDEIAQLKESDKIQSEKIDMIREVIDENREFLNKMQAKEDSVTVATCKNILRSLHAEYTSQGYVTQDDLDTFLEIGAVYEEAGGNGTYHLKLKPEVLNLPLKN